MQRYNPITKCLETVKTVDAAGLESITRYFDKKVKEILKKQRKKEAKTLVKEIEKIYNSAEKDMKSVMQNINKSFSDEIGKMQEIRFKAVNELFKR